MAGVNVKGIDELTAAIPHLLGFHPVESMVVVPLQPGPPVARVDLPTTAGERDEAANVLVNAYLRHARPGEQLAVMVFSEDLAIADRASQQLAGEFTVHGIEVPARVWVSDDGWTNMNTGDGGVRTRDAESLMAAEFVVAGRRAPATSRAELAAQLIGDRGPVEAQLPVVRAQAAENGAAGERAWAACCVDRFHANGAALTDTDAARLLFAVQDVRTRDDALLRITTDNAGANRALWADLTRRAPDDVRTPAATLLGFSSWLGGDGAGAWVALDQIPSSGQGYRLADLLAQVLEQAVPPSAWEGTRAGRPDWDDSIAVAERTADRRHGLRPAPELPTLKGPHEPGHPPAP